VELPYDDKDCEIYFIKMDTAVAKLYNDAFDAEDQKHCTWFKMLADVMAEPGEEMEKHGQKVLRVMKSNPMGLTFNERNMLDLVFIQFSLGLKYSRAALDGKAWIPQSSKTHQE
jgi:hypothetical protein